MDQNPPTLLICTVGGSTEPLVQSLSYWRPTRVLFVPSEQTKAQVDAILREFSERTGQPMSAGAYDHFPVPDAESLDRCLHVIRRLDDEVHRWRQRGSDYRVVADFTAGTKCMTAALALQARRWPCSFSYVGGAQRTKDGVGVAVSGSERVVHQANPWDALGHQAVEDFIVLFDQHAFVAAAAAADKAKRRVTVPHRKRELAVLELLAKGFDAWDRFDHDTSANKFTEILKAANDLRAVLGAATAARVLDAIKRLEIHIGAVRGARPPSQQHVLDLLANAKRREREGRLDEAVARLYRAIEATAQVALRERHGIENTGRVPLDSLPESAKREWESKARDGVVALGLQDAYRLLHCLEDPLGSMFESTGLDAKESPLSARNQSILAHGFANVSEKVFGKLWSAALRLAGVDEKDLPSFLTIGAASLVGPA